MDKQKIKAILFDFNGTLFKDDVNELIAWNKALKNFNIVVDPKLYPIYAEKSPEWIEDDIKQRYNGKFQSGELIALKNKIFTELFGSVNNDQGLTPYASEAVTHFYNKSFLLAVCTNGNKEGTISKLKDNGLEKYFNVIVSASEVDSAKPAPDVYLLAIEKLGLKADECLTIEDTESGLIAAKEAGTFCFIIPNKYSQNQNFERADKVIASFQELIEFFS